MSLWRIAWAYLWNRKLTTGLTILSVALAVGLISTVLTIRDETEARFLEEQNAYDIVVGPTGASPLQLVLSSVYFLDQAGGTLKYSMAEKIRAFDENIEHVFPIALGDVYGGFRIVGTERALFDFPWIDARKRERYPFKLSDGVYFDAPMEAVVGYRVARATGLKVGDTFVSLHGSIAADISHTETPYTVVGTLKPSGTSNDRAIFVSLESVWESHADHAEESDEIEELQVSAFLVDVRGAARFRIRGELPNAMTGQSIIAASPIREISKLYDQVLDPAIAILKAIGYVVVVISAISILIGLYLSIIQRKRDLAIMRALGASATEIFGAVMIEAFLVTTLGIAAGWVLGKATAMAVGLYMGRAYGLYITGTSTSSDEIYFFSIVAGIGLLAGIVPAWQAYQTDVAKDLSAT